MKVCNATVDPPMKLRILPNRGTVVHMKMLVKHVTARKAVRFQLNAIENRLGFKM